MTCPVQPHHVGELCGFRTPDAAWLPGLLCNEQATHKVGIEDSDPTRHNLTQYLCCKHTQQVFGKCP